MGQNKKFVRRFTSFRQILIEYILASGVSRHKVVINVTRFEFDRRVLPTVFELYHILAFKSQDARETSSRSIPAPSE